MFDDRIYEILKTLNEGSLLEDGINRDTNSLLDLAHYCEDNYIKTMLLRHAALVEEAIQLMDV